MNRENPCECDCCGFETTALRLYPSMDTTIGGGGGTRKDDFWYCNLCSSSMASNFSRYPGRNASNAEVLQTICLVGNTILAAIKERQP